ncbi:hypothetical protein DVH24_004018 [Malus domestica]|uniref:Uncharacterized protein n=1 Tax=Malus domestica TaxID=3750 RepID=A0A498K7K1_MALDO|nr:hypothetical protein DVH24_004018 [Malus domestica]
MAVRLNFHLLLTTSKILCCEEERQHQQLRFKSTTRAMEATIHRKPTPAHRLSTPSRTTGLGREIWTPYAPAWRSFHHCCFIGRSTMLSLHLGHRSSPRGSCLTRSTNIAFAPYGDYWRTTTKNLHTRAFKHKARSAINLTREIYSLTYSITSRAAFGKKKTRDHEKFIYVAEEAGKVAGGFALADLYPSVSLLHLVSGIRPKLERLRKQADRIIENIINEHQKDLETTKMLRRDSGRSCTCVS